MKLPASLAGSLSEALCQKLIFQITRIQQLEDNFPGAVIIHDLEGAVVYMSRWGRNYLGISLDAVQELGFDYYARFFNAEDAKDYVPKILGLLQRNNDEEFVSFFQQVRPADSNNWAWYLSATKIFFRNDIGKPICTLTHALPVDAQHHMAAKAQRLLEENNFLRSHYAVFNLISKREREVLRLMALGESSPEMAGKLNISEKTVKTHRKNIRRKLNVENNYDIMRFAQAFDLI